MKFFSKKKDDFDYNLQRSCLTCSTSFQGRFCSRCGEKVVEPYDRSVKHFLDNLLNALTFIDGKFYKSIITLLTRPGKMSADIAIGIRQPYMKPVAFFFVGNFIYFLVPLFETFNSTLYAQMEFMPYSNYVQSIVESYLREANISLEEFTFKYNPLSTNWSKIILILLALLTFPFVVLVNYSRKGYLSDHFIFSLEYASYLVFVPTILLSIFLFGIIGLLKIMGLDVQFILTDKYTAPILLLLIFLFFFFGNRNFYAFPWWRAAVSSLFLTLSMWVVIHAYRFILFMITMASV